MPNAFGQRKQKLINDRNVSTDTTYSSEHIERLLEDIPILGQNILHNWDFRSPVNQRGQAMYTNNTNTTIYSIDRWMIRGGTLEVISGAIRFTQTFLTTNLLQRLDFAHLYLGKQVSMSVMVNNDVFSRTFNMPINNSSGTGDFSLGANLVGNVWRNSNGTIDVQLRILGVNPIDIQAAKLELGPVSTLANDPPVDRRRELLNCLPYQLSIRPQDSTSGWVRPSTVGIVNQNGILDMQIPIPVPLRITPAITMQSNWRLIHVNSNARLVVTNIVHVATSAVLVTVRVTAENLIVGGAYLLEANNDPNANIIFDANL